ncbi:MAG: hypothetical protein ACYC5M_10005 [Anaerolineae bacterium]
MRISDEMAATLGSYVYVYIDPRDHEPFYVGKGKGERMYTHLKDPSESAKAARIAGIQAEGLNPQIDVLCLGPSD